jgi:hypothetical protein
MCMVDALVFLQVVGYSLLVQVLLQVVGYKLLLHVLLHVVGTGCLV